MTWSDESEEISGLHPWVFIEYPEYVGNFCWSKLSSVRCRARDGALNLYFRMISLDASHDDITMSKKSSANACNRDVSTSSVVAGPETASPWSSQMPKTFV